MVTNRKIYKVGICGEFMKKLITILSLAAISALTFLGCDSDKKALDKQVAQYANSTNLDKDNLRWVLREGVPIDSVLAYDDRFTWDDTVGVTREKGKQDVYESRNHTWVKSLYDKKIYPSIANKYNDKFDFWDISYLNGANISPELADKFEDRFTANDMVVLKDLSFEDINKYSGEFSSHSIRDLSARGVDPAYANDYVGTRFTPYHDLGPLFKAKVPMESSLKYSEEFGGKEIAILYENSISPENTEKFLELNKKYGSRIDAQDMVAFKKEGSSYREIEEKVREVMINNRIIN